MKAKVTKLSHEDIVNLISTAFYGNVGMGVSYPEDYWDGLIEEAKTKTPCIEDKCADLLLEGYSITVADFYALEYGIHSDKGRMVKNDGWEACYEDSLGEYTLSLKDILEACSTEEGFPLACELFVSERGDFYDAYNLIQIAIFGEKVYC